MWHLVHFLHIRKTGGTAIRRALEGRDWFTGHEHGVILRQIPPRVLVMFAVRDPVERVTSAFYDRLRQGSPAYACPRLAQEIPVFNTYQSITTVAEGLWSPDVMARARAASALASMEHTSCRYWDWLGDRQTLRARLDQILYVLFTPSLQADLNAAMTRAGHAAVTLPTAPEVAHVAPEAHRHAIPPHYRKALAQHYSADYDCLRALAECLPHDRLSPALLAWIRAQGAS